MLQRVASGSRSVFSRRSSYQPRFSFHQSFFVVTSPSSASRRNCARSAMSCARAGSGGGSAARAAGTAARTSATTTTTLPIPRMVTETHARCVGWPSLQSLTVAQTLPRNADVADQFDLLADLLELEGAESFRVLAYRRAASRMRETSGSIAQLALAGKAKELQGIGKTIEEKIVQIVDTGEIEALTKKKAGVPAEVVLFMRLPGLGPKTAARIWRDLGVTTVAELRAAAEQQQLRMLAGLGAKSEEKILRALADESPTSDRPP